MHIALASCRDLPAFEVDDAPLRAALRVRGATVESPAWDDATVDWSRFDACLIRTTWDYMERRADYLQWAAAVARVSTLFNPLPVVRWNTRKTYLRDVAAAGVAIAPTVFVDRGEAVDIAALAAAQGWRRGFVKPLIGACARETLPFSTDAAGIRAAQAHVDRLLVREGLMLQPFLESVYTEGEYSVVFVEGEPTHAVRKIPVAGDYRVMDDFGATDEPASLAPAELVSARRACEACESYLGCERPLLYARVDFLREASGGLVVNEIELVEPSLFFRHAPDAATRLAEALLARIA